MPQSLPRRKQTLSARRSAGLESLKANKTRRRAAAWPPFARYLSAGTAGTNPAQGAGRRVVKWQTGGQRNRPPVLYDRPFHWNQKREFISLEVIWLECQERQKHGKECLQSLRRQGSAEVPLLLPECFPYWVSSQQHKTHRSQNYPVDYE